MGLDSYLERDERLTDGWHKVDVRAFVDDKEVVRKGVENPVLNTSVAYWRKANQIHNWFVENVQGGDDDCKRHYVPYHKLRELYDICDRILKATGKTRQKLAKELLPTREGFFFGTYEYDDYYYECIEDTCKQLEPILAYPDLTNVSYYYQSSW